MRKMIRFIPLIMLMSCQTATPLPQAPTPTPTSIASFTYSNSNGGLWQVDLTGRKVNLLPDDGIEKWYLGWSPDRKTLAYIARYYEPAGAEESLFVLGSDGKPRKLMGPATQIDYRWTDSPQHLVVWSSDMRLDAVTASDVDTVSGKWFQVDTEAGAAVETNPPDTTLSSTQLSPDGKWTVASELDDEGGMEVYVVDSAGTKISKLLPQGPFLGLVPTGRWSPDSRLFAFRLDLPANPDLYVFSRETKTATQVVHYTDKGQHVQMGKFQWSPNSGWLSFAFSDSQSGFQLCVLHGPDYALRCFKVQWKWEKFEWSTDGQYLAFLSWGNDGQMDDLYVLEPATGQVLNLTDDGDAQSEDWFTAP